MPDIIKQDHLPIESPDIVEFCDWTTNPDKMSRLQQHNTPSAAKFP